MRKLKQQQQQQQLGEQEESQKKERHIVTWTQEEDDILRKQISIHGTENWAIIASNFNDKTTRQCRRRWYTYLNSDFKKGGWSPEEDLLLCEAQKIFGNRWTEIAKVVSGRTDNAVKNRFSTLCKKRAKFEALAKENSTSFTNSNNKRTIFQQGDNRESTSEAAAPTKKMRRAHIPDAAEKINFGDRSHKQYEATIKQQSRALFSILGQNLPGQHESSSAKISSDAHNCKTQGTFLKEDDPKISVIMQQAELLSSLALKVNTDDVGQSLEDAWKVLQEFLNQTKESDILKYKISDLQLVDLKDIMEEFKSSNEGSQQCWRQPELYEDSPSSSEYSTGSTLLPHSASDNLEHSLLQDIGTDLKPIQLGDQKRVSERGKEDLSSATMGQDIFPSCEEQISNDGIASTSSSTEFNSPIQVTPMFRSLAAGIPSPQFSESERNFLMKTLGMESPSMNAGANPSQPPPCKRALLHSL
ncbi:transcription factor MYB88-like isoform X2 [Prosopis cineraria]|uniref:transcription factor MYB88-like isoform X2 n=1 Tax=Prosopis cineraria TaxID=364024 RepID=UPI00240F9CCA|nr:transcription factor MYB88-like isoform X2 [Prosopis cineraria]